MTAEHLKPPPQTILLVNDPADSAGLPPLRDIDGDGVADWECRTFILNDPTLPRGFMRAKSELSPP